MHYLAPVHECPTVMCDLAHVFKLINCLNMIY